MVKFWWLFKTFRFNFTVILFSQNAAHALRIWTWSQRKLNISVPSLILGQYFSSYLLADDSRETQIKWLRLRLPRDDKTKNLGLQKVCCKCKMKSLILTSQNKFDITYIFSLIELLSETKMFLSLMHFSAFGWCCRPLIGHGGLVLASDWIKRVWARDLWHTRVRPAGNGNLGFNGLRAKRGGQKLGSDNQIIAVWSNFWPSFTSGGCSQNSGRSH